MCTCAFSKEATVNSKAVLRLAGPGKSKNSQGWDQAPPFLLLLVPTADTEPTESGTGLLCPQLTHELPARARPGAPSCLAGETGRIHCWESSGILPALLSLQSGVLVMVEACPLSLCWGTDLLSLQCPGPLVRGTISIIFSIFTQAGSWALLLLMDIHR